LIADADPALVELNRLEDRLWHRLGVSLEQHEATGANSHHGRAPSTLLL
jgi:hypothetical protein